MAIQAELERLAARVRAAARDDGLIETAQVKLMGLDDVRRAAGARWPRMREQVRAGSLGLIAQRIGPDDAVIPCGDGFLVVFADSSTEQTQARCREIREALVAFYLGEEGLGALRADVERETVSAAHLAGLVSNGAAAAPPPIQRNQLKLGRFWPIWSSRHSGVAAYHCAPCINGPDGPRIGYSADFLAKATHEKRDFLDLDLCLMEQACAASETASAPIGLSVHATTMQVRRSRTIYLSHLAANSSPARQRMFVTITEIEPGTPLISLTEWTSALKHHFSRVALDLHHGDRALGSMASSGAWAAGYHLTEAQAGSSAQVRAALTELDGWCRTLSRQGMLPFVNGFQTGAFLEMAKYSDIAFASGESLWPSMAAPENLAAPKRTGLQRQRAAISSD
ncbi:MAG: hypothetical protein H7124_12060 [Phycisphaerales bacterium]|nr:hypothetical protein [Hyphomonadaceae bacterium]